MIPVFRTDTNLVEVVTVRTRPQVDPDEPIVGRVHIWEKDGFIDVAITDEDDLSVASTYMVPVGLVRGAE
jgi:hypothetical protein